MHAPVPPGRRRAFSFARAGVHVAVCDCGRVASPAAMLTPRALQEALGLEDRVRFVNFATAPCMMKVMAPQNATFGGCGRDFVADNDYDENAVPTPLEEFDAEFKFSPADPELKQIPFTCAPRPLLLHARVPWHTPAYPRCPPPSWHGAGAPYPKRDTLCRASADPSPLARVQHLVYMGAFFNAEARATARVQEIANAYRMASAPAPNGPMVVWASRSSFLFGYADSDGNPFPPDMAPDHFTFSYARYKTQLTSDAGGQMLPAADVEEVETSGAMALEGATSAGQEVKFIVALYDSEAAMLNLLQPLLKRVDVFIYDGTPPENGTVRAPYTTLASLWQLVSCAWAPPRQGAACARADGLHGRVGHP